MHPLQLVFIAMMLCVLAYLALNVIGWVVRRYVTVITSSEPDAAAPDTSVAGGVVGPPATDANRIAMPHNAHNEAVVGIVYCIHITKLAQETGDDPDSLAAVVTALARVIVHAKKADGTAKLGQTDAIRYGLGIAPGGSNPLYALARAALQAELARQRGEQTRDQIDEVRGTEVIRRDAAGERYIIGENGQRLPA